MQIPKDATLLRIFIGESDRWQHGPFFLPDLEEMIGGGLVTLEKIKVVHYRHERPEPE